MSVIDWLNENIIWGIPMLILFLFTGIHASVKIDFSQFNISKLLKKTIFSIPSSGIQISEKNLSPFQTLTSTLAVTLGTGNIVALGVAVAMGGAGAVFWMWISAFLGMATTYLENYFGMRTRKKNPDGSHFGGAFFYIEKAINKGAAVFFAICCLLTSLGMGNLTQINAMSDALNRSFGTPVWICGMVAASIIGVTIFGGAKFLGEITEKIIPIISGVYIVGCLIVITLNFSEIPYIFIRILRDAFDLRAVGGGILGSAMLRGMNWGFRRGIFSNEAGLGSTVILNTMSNDHSADKQGRWAMLCVFIDTIVMCTLTALVILAAADVTESTVANDGSGLASVAFSNALGAYAGGFVNICIALFALATASGWAVFGTASLKYLFPKSGNKFYLLLYIACSFLGAVINLEIAWGFADLTNGLMAIPNLAAVNILIFKTITPKTNSGQKYMYSQSISKP
ncbi:MAG: alanine:cation symporter family protein [Eubacterium sp.]|nr:alanine:cation symporter family protein [Eubacterium sp.]